MSESSQLIKQAFQALDQGRPADAATLLKDHLWRDTTDGVAYAALGVALSQLGDSHSALEAMEQAHYLRPMDARVLYNYGLVLAAAGQPKAARARFAAALKVDPSYDRASRCMVQLDVVASRAALPASFPNADGERESWSAPLSLGEAPSAAEDLREAEFVDHGRSENGHARPPFAHPPVDAAPPAPERTLVLRKEATVQVREEAPAAVPAPPVMAPAPRPEPTAPAPPLNTPIAASVLARASAVPHAPPAALLRRPPKPPSRLATGAVLLVSTAALAGAIAYTFWPTPPAASFGAPAAKPLRQAQLVRGRLHGADLSSTNLQGQKLAGEDLGEARLRGADLSGADLTGANLNGADLTDAFLRGTDLSRARLIRARLERTNLEACFLRGGDLSSAVLISARLSRAYLHSATLSGADLTRADLQRATLADARLDSAKLGGADLRGADLNGADFSNAALEGAQLQGARYSSATLWPIGFDAEAKGAILGTGAPARDASASAGE